MLKLYIQSFLHWLFVQNPNMLEWKNDEIANYMLQNFNHPNWFYFMYKKDAFNTLIEVEEIISACKNNADAYEPAFVISPKIALDYDKVKAPERPQDKELNQLRDLYKKKNKFINFNELNKMSRQVVLHKISSMKEGGND